jgi:hypothetical protein
LTKKTRSKKSRDTVPLTGQIQKSIPAVVGNKEAKIVFLNQFLKLVSNQRRQKDKNSRVVELVLEWRALLYGESVGLPGELVTHHLQVAVRQRLVPDIRRIS